MTNAQKIYCSTSLINLQTNNPVLPPTCIAKPGLTNSLITKLNFSHL